MELHKVHDFLPGLLQIDSVPIEDLISDAVESAGGMDAEGVRDAIATALVNGTNITITPNDPADTITIAVTGLTSAAISDFAAAVVTAANAGVIDADTLGGDSKASIISQAVASVVGGASAAYDTLVELQALMEADDTQTTAMLASIAARARFHAEDITSGAPTDTVTHGFALATAGDFTYRIFVKTTGVQEDYDVTPVNGNTVTITDESGGNIPAGRRIILFTGV